MKTLRICDAKGKINLEKLIGVLIIIRNVHDTEIKNCALESLIESLGEAKGKLPIEET